MLQAVLADSRLVLLVLVFVAVVLLLESLYLLWQSRRSRDAKKLRQRLQSLSAAPAHNGQASLLKTRALSRLPLIERILLSLPRIHRLDRFLVQSGVGWSVEKLLFNCCGFALTGWAALVLLIHPPVLIGVLTGACLIPVPLLYVQLQRQRRLTKLERQLPEALDLIARALRSGHGFSAGLKMVGEEMAEPLAGEFRAVHDEVNFGVSLQQALTNLSERVPLTDLRYFVVAVLIQRDSGGNLTEVLSNLSRLIRDRLKLLAKVRVLSSEGRLSAWILVLLPFALAGIMSWANPAFMSPLWQDPIGITIVKYMLSLMAIGIIILRAITKIRV